MKKLFGKFAKRSRPADEVVAGAEHPAAKPLTAVPLERLGLIHLADGTPSPDDGERYPVDIIAVHGLNGDCYTTWTHESGRLWLRDFLPNSLPGCRVFTYGYPSQVFSKSIAEVKGYARRLLGAIRDIQDGDLDKATRRIIFVCHSLGGIVCKQALVIAHEDDSSLGNRRLLQSVTGIVFLGTPHRGSAIASLGTLVGRIINAFLITKPIRTDHFRLLEYDSKPLQDLSDSVRNRLADLKIVSFYETMPEPPSPFVIVDKASATLMIPGEDIYPLYATHRDLCRFPSENSEYKAVFGALRRIIAQTAPSRTSTHSSQKTWDDSEKSCMSLFSKFDISDYQAMLPMPAKGTCQWILRHPLFVSWLEKAENALLWLTGHPGCGKTILSFFLAKQLETPPTPRPASNVCIFFCDDKISKQKNANNILIGLIFQLIRRHQSLARYARKVYQMHGQNIVQSFTALWTLFKDIATDPRSGPTIIIIDALDECEADTRRSLLNAIKIFIQGLEGPTPGRQHVKFVLTSRPGLTEVERMIDDVSEHRIPIDEGQSDHDADVQIFIQQRLDEISKLRQLAPEIKDSLQDSLYSRSGQTFLWVHMVLAALESSPLLSVNDLKAFVQRIPPDLEMTYMGFVSSIHTDQIDAASKLLKLILGSSRPLTLDEINIAFSIEPSHRTAEQVKENCQTGMHRTLQSILGPLVRVSGSKISLVHQSAKEFILQQSGTNGMLPPAIRAVREEECALAIATACIEYLLLDDFGQDFFTLVNSPVKSTSDSSEPIETSSLSSSPGKPFWEDDEEELNAHNLFKEPSALNEDTCQLLASKYPFYQYAALYWTDHFVLCEASASTKLRDSIKTLLDINTANCTNWLRFHATEATAGNQSIPTSFNSVTLAAFFNFHGTLKDYLHSQETIPQDHLDNALFWGAQQGHGRIVNTLLRAGADPNTRECGGQTALIVASKNGHLDCVRTLLSDDRTEINLKGDRGRTALSFACYGGHREIVKTLLSRKDCLVDEEDDSGCTALIWAAGGGHSEIVTLLAQQPTVNINHRDKTGRTVVSWAAGDGMDQVLKTLLRLEGIDANLKDNEGRSPLSWAAGNGCTEAMRVLVRDSKVDKASVDKKHRNAISWACGRGHVDALRTLLKYRCPGVDEMDESGWTPLAWAIQTNSPETVETLVSNKSVDLERRDHSGRTPLSWAVSYGHLEVVRTLLRAGADPATTSESGITPISTAQSMGRSDITEELLYFMREGPRTVGASGRTGGMDTREDVKSG